MLTLTQKLDRLPPCICRLLAQSNGEFLSDKELTRMLRWGENKLRRISKATSWTRITVEDADAFLAACGLRWSSQRRERWLLRVAVSKGLDGLRRMKHLRKPVAARAATVTMLLRRTEKLLGSKT